MQLIDKDKELFMELFEQEMQRVDKEILEEKERKELLYYSKILEELEKAHKISVSSLKNYVYTSLSAPPSAVQSAGLLSFTWQPFLKCARMAEWSKAAALSKGRQFAFAHWLSFSSLSKTAADIASDKQTTPNCLLYIRMILF